MPSKAALAAVEELSGDPNYYIWDYGADCPADDTRKAAVAAIIDAHFSTYLAAVEALRKLEDGIYPFDTDDTWGYMIGDDSLLQNARAALAAIDSPHGAATLAPGDQG